MSETFQPHNYQQAAIQWGLSHEKCGLFLPMGAGKTAVTLTIIQEMMYLDISRVLIIGPKRVVESTWPAEIKKWEHTQWMKAELITAPKAKGKSRIDTTAQIYLVSKENVRDLIETLGRKWPFDMVVIDELSTFKNSSSKRFKALRAVMPRVTRFIGLTGTPAPNGIPDLWAQIYLMDRGDRLGKSLTSFRYNYLIPNRRNGHIVYDWIPQQDAEERIYSRLSDICMSIRQKDCAKLPPVSYITQPIEFDDELETRYHEFKYNKVLEFEKTEVLAANAGVLCGYLLQFTSGEMYTEDKKRTELIHDLKLKALEDLMISANGHPVMVFYYFKHELARIKKHFEKDYKIGTLDSPEDVDRWNRGEFDILLLHPASAGHGLNLQEGGNIAVWYSLPNWNLELYQQANARLYRQGQKKAVVIYHLITTRTIEEDMMKALNEKDVSQTRLIEALKKEK